MARSGPLEQLEATGSPSTLDNSLLLEWVNANKGSEVSSELGIASTLYQTCLQTLTEASRQYTASPKASRRQKTLLRDSHARLCLFGDGLIEHGGLESCLKLDVELSGEMIALLCNIGKLLLKGASKRDTRVSLAIFGPSSGHADEFHTHRLGRRRVEHR
jgi:hypothetical protein